MDGLDGSDEAAVIVARLHTTVVTDVMQLSGTVTEASSRVPHPQHITSGRVLSCSKLELLPSAGALRSLSLFHLNSLLATASPGQVAAGLVGFRRRGKAKELSLGPRSTRPRPRAAWSLFHPTLPPPSKQSISVVLQGKHIYWLVTACQCGSLGPVAEGISLGRGQGEKGGN